jgi:hypothetical protein
MKGGGVCLLLSPLWEWVLLVFPVHDIPWITVLEVKQESSHLPASPVTEFTG